MLLTQKYVQDTATDITVEIKGQEKTYVSPGFLPEQKGAKAFHYHLKKSVGGCGVETGSTHCSYQLGGVVSAVD